MSKAKKCTELWAGENLVKEWLDVISGVCESQMQINWYHESSRTVIQQLNFIEGFLIMQSLNKFTFDFQKHLLILDQSKKLKTN